MTPMRQTLCVAVLGLLTATASSQAADLDRTAVDFTIPSEIKWVRNAAGTNEQAVLFGDPSKPGPYVVRIKWLPGNMSRPHSHPNDRFFAVLSGTWWVGPVKSSTRRPPSPSRRAATSFTTGERSTTTAPRARRPSSRCGEWDRPPPRPSINADTVCLPRLAGASRPAPPSPPFPPPWCDACRAAGSHRNVARDASSAGCPT